MTFSFKSEEWKRTVSKRVAIVFLRIYHWPPMCVSIKYPYPPQPPRKVTRNSEGEGGSKAANLVCVCVGGGGYRYFLEPDYLAHLLLSFLLKARRLISHCLALALETIATTVCSSTTIIVKVAVVKTENKVK